MKRSTFKNAIAIAPLSLFLFAFSGSIPCWADNSCTIPSYDISESTFGGQPKYSGTLGILEDLYITTKTVGTDTEYTFNGKITVQKDEIGPIEKVQFVNLALQPPVLSNTTYTDSLCPTTIQTGSKISNFTCVFSTKENPSLNGSTKLIPMYIPQDKTITLRSTLKAIGDIPTTPCETKKVEQVTSTTVSPKDPYSPTPDVTPLCASGNFRLLGGNCDTKCGTNQAMRMGKCECLVSFMQDPKNKNDCITDPSYNVSVPTSPTSGGGSCSLIRK